VVSSFLFYTKLMLIDVIYIESVWGVYRGGVIIMYMQYV